MKDTLDIIKNIETIYNSDTAFSILKDFERVIDELDLYVYKNWENGELAQGPDIERHFVTCSFIWDEDEMPDPMGAKRLVDYDCKVSYKKDSVIVPRKIEDPDDMRPGTKKGKLDQMPIWLVTIRMPKDLIRTIYSGYEVEQEYNKEPANAEIVDGSQSVEAADEVAPEGL